MPTKQLFTPVMGGGANPAVGALLNTDRSVDFVQSGNGQELIGSGVDSALAPDAFGRLSIVFWFSFDQLPTAGQYAKIVTTDAGSVATDLWSVQIDGANGQLSFVTSDGGSYHSIDAAFLALQANKWYMALLEATQTPTNGITVYDTNALINSASGPGGIRIANPSAPLKVGGGLGTSVWSNIRIDSLGFRTGGWGGADIAYLWNNGKGRRGNDLAGLTVQPSRWFDFDERFGPRKDLSGSVLLTETDSHGNPTTIMSTPPRGQF